MTTAGSGFAPLVTVVGFHHARLECAFQLGLYMADSECIRGPEVESWYGAKEGTDPAIDHEWPLLPFMALSDGAHAYGFLLL
jgi:hypothetical protein